MINHYSFTLPDHPVNPVLTDPPAHRYGIRRESDGRWYNPSEWGWEQDDLWKLFPFRPYCSAIEAYQQARELAAAGYPVRVVALKK